MVGFVAYARYLRTLVWHKTLIFAIGCWVNWRLRGTSVRVPYARLLFHDWVKFLPAEFIPYARYYSFPRDAVPANVKQAFLAAYQHHHQRMDHHWEYHVAGYTSAMSDEQIQVRWLVLHHGLTSSSG